MIRLPFLVLLSAIAALPAASPASAALYKCQQDGAVAYADQPCADAQALKQPPLPTVPALKSTTSPPSASGKPPTRAADATSPKADKKQATNAGAKAESSQKKKCDKLALHRRWAEQDVQHARAKPLRPQDKALDSALRKARRADELYRLECAAPS